MPLKRLLTDICLGTITAAESLRLDATFWEAVIITLGTLVIKEAFVLAWKVVLLKNPALARKFDHKRKSADELERDRRNQENNSLLD